MSVTTNAARFAQRMHRAGAAVQAANRDGVTAAGATMKGAILAAAANAGAKPDPGWVQTTPRGSSDHPQTVVALYGHRAYWAERGTRDHTVLPRRGQAVMTPRGPRASAHVRGMRARPFWAPGTATGARAVAATAQNAVWSALRRELGG